jgi:succinoglycan biosynthesis transport protein ExoP
MSISQFMKVLKARWKLALTVQLLIVAAVAALTFLLPPQYTASASVLVDVKSPDPIAGTVFSGGPLMASLMANEANVIQSERVLLRAVVEMRLMDDPKRRSEWLEETDGVGDYPAWLASRILKDMDVKPAREGSTMTVLFTSPDRTFSAAMANAIVKAYIDTTLSLRVDPARQFNQFFDERSKGAREALETAQRRLSMFQQSKGMIASDERLDVENARLAELSSQLVTLQALASESGSRQREAGRQVDSLPEIVSSPLLAELNGSLAQQESRLLELESRLKEQHPQVIELKSNIAQTRARIRAESQRVVRGLGVANEVNRSRVGQVSASLEAQRAKLLQLKGQRDEAAVLQRDVENAQRAYDSLLTRLNQSELESQLKQTNVSSLKTASPPPKQSSPKVAINLSVALVLGALLALAAVFVRELNDRRLRTTQDVIELLGQPFLGVLPASAALASPTPSRVRVLAGSSLSPLRLEAK